MQARDRQTAPLISLTLLLSVCFFSILWPKMKMNFHETLFQKKTNLTSMVKAPKIPQ